MTKIAMSQELKQALLNRYPPMQRIDLHSGPKEEALKKEDYKTIEIRSDPNDTSSNKVKLTVVLLKDNKPEQIVAWHKSVIGKVLPSMGLQDNRSKARFMEETMKEPIVSKWRTIYEGKMSKDEEDKPTLTDDNFKKAVQAFLKTVMPHHCLRKQRRYLLFAVRKPFGMTVRRFVQELEEKNNDLALYPPKFDNTQKLPKDIVSAVRDNSWPVSWQKQAILQGHDTLASTNEQTIEFFERIEETEGDKKEEDFGWTIPRKKRAKNSHESSESGDRKRSRGSDKAKKYNSYDKKKSSSGKKPYVKYTPEQKKAYYEKKKKEELKSQEAMVIKATKAAVNAIYAAEKAKINPNDNDSDSESDADSVSSSNSDTSTDSERSSATGTEEAFASMNIDGKKKDAEDDTYSA